MFPGALCGNTVKNCRNHILSRIKCKFDSAKERNIAAPYLNVDMCRYLVTLNVFELGYALHILVITVHGRS
jgi:hypothetical protein